MRFVLHPKVYSDIDEIMGYYERVATRQLANEFYAELRYYMQQAAERPESFAIRERELRRVNLQRFPYHFLFRIAGESCEFLSCDTIGDVLPLASVANNVPNCRLVRLTNFSGFRNSGNVEVRSDRFRP